MSATLAVEDAAVLPEMSLQIRQPHVPANSIVSRKASGGTLPGIDLTRSADLEDRMDLT